VTKSPSCEGLAPKAGCERKECNHIGVTLDGRGLRCGGSWRCGRYRRFAPGLMRLAGLDGTRGRRKNGFSVSLYRLLPSLRYRPCRAGRRLALQEEIRNVARAVVNAVGELRRASCLDSMPHSARRDRKNKTREGRSSIHWNPLVFVFSIIETAKGRGHQDCPNKWSMDRRAFLWLKTAILMENLIEVLQETAEPLPDVASGSFATMFDRYRDAQVVLIGEASHGTHEFYQARAAITRHLVKHHGFSIVAVEADWPDADQVDRCVRGRENGGWHESAFSRFPTWMWRNTDVQAFTRWLCEFNRTKMPKQRVSFVVWTCTACVVQCAKCSVT
jgi:hypothetical protein